MLNRTLLLTLFLACFCFTACSEKEGDAAPAAKSKTGRKARVVDVITMPAGPRDFSDRIEALGTANAKESVVISANISEKITKIAFVDGQHVEVGEVLVQLNDRAERAEQKALQATLSERQKALQRTQKLRRQNIVSQAELDIARAEVLRLKAELAASAAAIADRVVRAPFAGQLGLRQVSVGALIQPGRAITTLDDLSEIRVDFSVPSAYLSVLQPGVNVRARTAAFQGEQFTGVISSVATQVDPATRTIAVRATFANTDAKLRPGLLMELELVANPRQQLTIPEVAVTRSGERQFCYVIVGEGVEQRWLKTGVRRGGWIEVLEGVKAGEQVAVHGAIKLRPKSKVRVLASVDDKLDIASVLAAQRAPKPTASKPTAAKQ